MFGEKRKKRVLFIYSCIQESVYLQYNIVQIYKKVNDLIADNDIYVLSSTDTMRLILPNDVSFFTGKITKAKILDIIKTNKIDAIFPVIGDKDDLIRELKKKLKKLNVKNLCENYYNITYSSKELKLFAGKAGFLTTKKESRYNNDVILNFIFIKDRFGNSHLLDVFEEASFNKKIFFCSQINYNYSFFNRRLRQMLRIFCEKINVFGVLFCVKISIRNRRVFFEKVDFNVKEEMMFFLQKRTMNIYDIMYKIQNSLPFFEKFVRNNFVYSFDYNKSFLLNWCNCCNYCIFSNKIKDIECIKNQKLYNFLRSLLKLSNHTSLFSQRKIDGKIMYKKSKHKSFHNHVLLRHSINDFDKINEQLMFFKISCLIQKNTGCRVLYITNKCLPILDLLDNCELYFFNDSKEIDVRELIDNYCVKYSYIEYKDDNIDIMNSIREQNLKIKLIGINDDLNYFQDTGEHLLRLCDKCKVCCCVGNIIDYYHHIIHYICIKDRYNNIYFPTIITEEFINKIDMNGYFFPMQRINYAVKDYVFDTAMVLLNSLNFYGLIDITFNYFHGVLYVEKVSLNTNSIIFFLNNTSMKPIFDTLIECLFNKRMKNIDNKTNQKYYNENLQKVCVENINDGQIVCSEDITILHAIDGYIKKIR